MNIVEYLHKEVFVHRKAATKEELERRIIELSNRLVDLGDLLKQAGDMYDTIKDIIYTITSARTGIIYELENLLRDYEQFKYSASKIKARRKKSDWSDWWGYGYDEDEDKDVVEIGKKIDELTKEWKKIDDELKEKEREVLELEYDRDWIMDEISELSQDLQQIVTEFEFSPDSFYYTGSAFIIPIIEDSLRDDADKSFWSRKAIEIDEEYKKFIQSLSPEELDKMIDQKADELLRVLNKYKELKNEVEKMSKQYKEEMGVFARLAKALEKEILETESFIVKVKTWPHAKSISWKSVAMYLMDRVDQQLREEAQKLIDEQQEFEERIKVDITKKESSYDGADKLNFFVMAFIADNYKKGYKRDTIWRRVISKFGDDFDKELLQEHVSSFYKYKKAEGLWEKMKEYMKRFWDKLSNAVKMFKDINKEFRKLLSME